MRPPFPWPCNQESLPWHGDQLNGNVILFDTHGPNRLARDETPYPLGQVLFCYFSSGPSCFLLRGLLLPSRGSLGEASLGFIFMAFIFYLLSPISRDNQEIMSRGPHGPRHGVREQIDLSMALEGPSFLLLSHTCSASSTSLHHYRYGLASEKALAP